MDKWSDDDIRRYNDISSCNGSVAYRILDKERDYRFSLCNWEETVDSLIRWGKKRYDKMYFYVENANKEYARNIKKCDVIVSTFDIEYKVREQREIQKSLCFTHLNGVRSESFKVELIADFVIPPTKLYDLMNKVYFEGKDFYERIQGSAIVNEIAKIVINKMGYSIYNKKILVRVSNTGIRFSENIGEYSRDAECKYRQLGYKNLSTEKERHGLLLALLERIYKTNYSYICYKYYDDTNCYFVYCESPVKKDSKPKELKSW